MKRVFLGALACALGLAATAPADAAEVVRVTQTTTVVTTRTYYEEHGVRFHGGWYYEGRHHHHWDHRRWDEVHHRYHYYDPYLRCYFYWEPVSGRYYPDGF